MNAIIYARPYQGCSGQPGSTASWELLETMSIYSIVIWDDILLHDMGYQITHYTTCMNGGATLDRW